MTTYTKAELATRVLRDAGLVASEETPSDADLVWVEETIDSEIDMMGAKGIPIWNGSSDEIPQEYLTTLSRRIVLAIAPSFGLTDVASATMAMEAVERDLRRLGWQGPTGKVIEGEYF